MQETRVDSRAEPQHEVAEKGPYRYRVPGAGVKPIRLASGPTEAQESWGILQGWEPAQEVTEVQLRVMDKIPTYRTYCHHPRELPLWTSYSCFLGAKYIALYEFMLNFSFDTSKQPFDSLSFYELPLQDLQNLQFGLPHVSQQRQVWNPARHRAEGRHTGC